VDVVMNIHFNVALR